MMGTGLNVRGEYNKSSEGCQHLDCDLPLSYPHQVMREQAGAQTRMDGIGCAGLLFLVMMLLVAAAGVIAPEKAESEALVSTMPPVDTATAIPLPTVDPTVGPPVVIVENAVPAPATAESKPVADEPPATEIPAPAAPAVAEQPPTSGVTAALPTPASGLTATVKVPILMYHYISDPPEDADIYREDLSVTPAAFREQLQYLADNGYTPVDLYDLSLAVTRQKALPPKPVILTFDDGYLDQYTNAFPLLKEFGFTGTFFIITGFVDSGNSAYMSWPMITEMAAAGMRMESHSRSHPDLSEAERDELIWQILGSQETLAAHIGYTPRFFCYPGGRYSDETIEMLQELDFWGAVTTAGGVMHSYEDRFEWSRVRMRNTTTLPVFAALLNP
jgi:peptidoglycan/xylan/chitin deacetylase (PgdA/CDA1 family)